MSWILLQGDLLGAGTGIPDGSVDAILTDPPYSRDAIELYEKLARLADRVLRPGGSCLVMTGTGILPDVISAMCPPLAYRWTIAYLVSGGAARIYHLLVLACWKPVIWLQKPPASGETGGFRADIVKGGGKSKRWHPWQQSVSGFAQLVRFYTRPGDLVLDPFCGTGTTGVAAVTQGRRFIGIDVDPEALEVARQRLEEITEGRPMRPWVGEDPGPRWDPEREDYDLARAIGLEF